MPSLPRRTPGRSGAPLKVAGLDLANGLTGIAVVDGDRRSRPDLLALCFVRGKGAPGPTSRVVCSMIPPDVGKVVYERPPGFARSDVHHGGQADIGWTLGRLGGWVECRMDPRPVETTEVGEWRDRMIELSTAWGVPLKRPPKTPAEAIEGSSIAGPSKLEREGDALVAVWSCGHRAEVEFAAIRQVGSCPVCTLARSRSVAVEDLAEWRREQWKKLACEAVAAHWPADYRILVDDARGRARTEKADHELVGVADACEAVWIAAGALPP